MRRVTCTLSTFGFMGMPAPAVQAYWYIPRLDHGEWVLFLIDTGASATCLNGIHALGLQQNMRLNTLTDSFGIGGNSQYYNERAVIVFKDDDGQLLARRVQIGIQQIQLQHLNNPNTLLCPSLLGRDILYFCKLNHHPPKNITLEFQ
ncbi:hypothetical protein ES705_10564 [subsurface metagenome]|jgi:hypothetical protein